MLEFGSESLDEGDFDYKFSDEFTFTKVIGKGAFAVVIAAVERSSQFEVAIKV